MSEELDALECLIETIRMFGENQIGLDKYEEKYNTIKQALQELQAIKSAEPSEAIDCFKRVWNDINAHNNYRQDFEDLKIVENYILKAQEQEKVLSIIIKKNVSVWGFRNRVFGYQKKQNGNRVINDTYEYYLNNFGCYHHGFDIELLTEEEFNTLKEYLK